MCIDQKDLGDRTLTATRCVVPSIGLIKFLLVLGSNCEDILVHRRMPAIWILHANVVRVQCFICKF